MFPHRYSLPIYCMRQGSSRKKVIDVIFLLRKPLSETQRHGNTVTLTGNARVEKDLPLPEGSGSAVTINWNGTIYLTGKGRLLNIDNSRKLTLDGVTLAGGHSDWTVKVYENNTLDKDLDPC